MLTDAQVVQLMQNVNEGEIMQGELAMTRADAAAVQAYATRMVAEHTAANAALTALIDAQNITPAESPAGAQLSAEAMATLISLRGAEEADFDRAYVTSQVMQHERVLGILDGALPDLTDDEVRDAAEAMRGAVAEHLEDARSLLEELGED
jgi:putative membrane protein